MRGKKNAKTKAWIIVAGTTLLAWTLSNAGAIPINKWTNIKIDQTFMPPDQQQNMTAFGVWAADVNGDGYLDIAAGCFLYINPGANMMGKWNRINLPVADGDACLMYDFDGDGQPEIIAMEYPNVLYYHATNKAGTAWTSHVIGQVPRAGHGNAQGQCLADIEPTVGGPNGKAPEVVLLSEEPSLYYFVAPTNPNDNVAWTRVQVASLAVGEDVSAADFDGDGFVDLATVDQSLQTVVWWKNPGTRKAGWTSYPIGKMDGPHG
ncbi:MAG: VCBS repeat-containing protein, partial [Chitinivibrionales bacterium]|nr:VCBS repeat-containing protein [Chitinivibrionales bacterium]